MKAIEAFPVSEEEAQDIDELKQKFPHVADLRTALEDYFHIYDDMAAMEPQKFDMYFADFIKDNENNSRKVNSSVVGEIHDKYVLGDISTSAALQSLQESGMSTDKADELIHTWGKETVQQGLSADEKALVTNSLDETQKQQFKETLIRAGYTEDEAQQILEQADQVEQQQTSMSGEVPLVNSYCKSGKCTCKESKRLIKEGFYTDEEREARGIHPQDGGGICNHCGSDVAGGDFYDISLDSTREIIVAAMVKEFNGPDYLGYDEREAQNWFGWDDDTWEEQISNIYNYMSDDSDYLCHDCMHAEVDKAVKQWHKEWFDF